MNHKLENAKDFEQLLHNQGFRVTEQRRVILDVLASHGWHLTAEEIYREARQLNRHINLATIYRTLTTLRETGLVQQYYVSPDHSESRFRLKEQPAPTELVAACPVGESLHFHCLKCGQVTVLDSLELVDLVQEILESQTSGFQVKQICMCVEGYCPDCAKVTR